MPGRAEELPNLGFDASAMPSHPQRKRPADVILLVMNGRVVHKVFSGDFRTEKLEDRRA